MIKVIHMKIKNDIQKRFEWILIYKKIAIIKKKVVRFFKTDFKMC
jgi:hypothetical protein